MTAILAATEIFFDSPDDERGPPAAEVIERLPLGVERVAGARPPATTGVFSAVWSGLKKLAGAAGRLITIGFLAVSLVQCARALWREIGDTELSRPKAGGRLLAFPGPQGEDRS